MYFLPFHALLLLSHFYSKLQRERERAFINFIYFDKHKFILTSTRPGEREVGPQPWELPACLFTNSFLIQHYVHIYFHSGP